MAHLRRHTRWLIFPTIAGAVSCAAALSPPPPPATAPAPEAAAPAVTMAPAPAASAPADAPLTPPPIRTKFSAGEPISALMGAIAAKYDVLIIAPKPVDVTLLKDVELPGTLDACIDLAQRTLQAQGYGVIKTVASSGRVALKLAPAAEVKQAEQALSPVTMGIDPAKIDASKPTRQVTHMLPIKHGEMIDTYRRTATEEKGVDATLVGSAAIGYTLVITGPAAAVQHAVESVVKIDNVPDVKTAARTVQLLNINATDAAARINAGGARGGGVHAVADTRTNSVVVTGPQDEVSQAITDLVGMDGYTGVRPRQVPPAPQQTAPPATPEQGGRGPDIPEVWDAMALGGGNRRMEGQERVYSGRTGTLPMVDACALMATWSQPSAIWFVRRNESKAPERSPHVYFS